MIIQLRYFTLKVSELKGIEVIDKRYKPARKCGTLKWKYVMELIEDAYAPPEIHPAGFR